MFRFNCHRQSSITPRTALVIHYQHVPKQQQTSLMITGGLGKKWHQSRVRGLKMAEGIWKSNIFEDVICERLYTAKLSCTVAATLYFAHKQSVVRDPIMIIQLYKVINRLLTTLILYTTGWWLSTDYSCAALRNVPKVQLYARKMMQCSP